MSLIPSARAEVLVVGAGMAGLTAAQVLQSAGKAVLLLEKGRGPGGRMATRRIGERTFDHGAQFITARSARFAAAIRDWQSAGVAEAWCAGFSAEADGHTRWRGRPAMNAIPKYLGRELAIQLETKLVSLSHDGHEWQVNSEAGGRFYAPILLLTAPVPQSLELVESGTVRLDSPLRQQLAAIAYERCFAVMAELNQPSGLPAPGGLAPAAGDVAWIADNQRKGISARPAVTIHGTPAFSMAHWEAEREQVGLALIQAASAWLGERPTAFQVHGWKYSKPTTIFPQPCVVAHQKPLLVLAGDAFGGPKVEGAALSGWAAAEAILNHPA